MNLRERVAAVVQRWRSRRDAPRRARTSMLLGGVLTVGGSFAPWAAFFFGYPGKATLGGFPGGARLFTLVLGLSAALVLFDIPGRRHAGVRAATGAVVVAGFNVIAIANDGNG